MPDILELSGSLAYLDDLHDQYADQPAAVDASWHALLARESNGHATNGRNGHGNGHASNTERLV